MYGCIKSLPHTMYEAGNFESNEKNQIITDLNRSCQAFFELCSIDAFQITASAFCAAASGVIVKAKIAYLKSLCGHYDYAVP